MATTKQPEDTDADRPQPQRVVNQVRIKGTFKKADNELNGLTSIAEELGDKPLERFAVVGLVERHKREEQDGTTTVTARFVQIEPLDGDAATAARDLMATAFTGRTGASSGSQPDLFADAHEQAPVRIPPPDDAGATVPPAAFVAPDNTDPNLTGPWPGDVDYKAARDEAADAAIGEAEAQLAQDASPAPAAVAQLAGRTRRGKG